MNKQHTFFLIFSFILLSSCKNKNTSDQEVFTEIPEDFISFYEQFHLDTAYQVAHIQFPLEGVPSLSEDTDLEGFTFWWERVGWKYHKPFNDNDGTYSRTFSNFAGIITERILDNSGQFTMLRRFSKMNDQWTLIYYKEMGR